MLKNVRQKMQWMWIVLVVGLLQVAVIQTQDATPTEVVETEPTAADMVPTATELPTEVPTEEPTEMPTEEPTNIPTEIPTEVITEAPSEMPPVVETTAEVMPEETEEVALETPDMVSGTEPIEVTPTIEVTEVVPTVAVEPVTVPDEPPMQLLMREMFNNGDVSPWLVPVGWSLVPNDSGQALQVVNSTEPLTLQKGVFFNVAVQARFAIVNGDAQLHIQRGNDITLRASLDDNGGVTLSKNDDILQTTAITLDSAETWHTLRLSIVEGVMRVAVDGDEIIAVVDGDALQAGGISISAGDDSSDEDIVNQVLVDDFFLWVPVSEADRYPSPTPMGAVTEAPAVVIVSTAVPTILPTESIEIKEESTGEEAVVVQPAARDVVVPLAIPNAPVLKSPADGAVIAKAQEKLKWYTTSGETYLVDMDNNEDFSSPLYVDVLESKQFTPPTDLPQDTYYWRVQAQNLDGVSDESDVWSFTVKILTSPADGDTVFMRSGDTPTSVSLRWGKVKSASNYLLYLYDDPLCTSMMNGYPADMGTSTSAKVILDKGQYCWKVQAVGVDSGIPDGSSMFTVSPPALAAPVLVSPEKKSMTNDTTPTLDWEGVADAVDYRVEWSTDKKFKTDVQSIIIPAPTTDYTLPALPDTAETTYYWQVAAMNDLAVVGNWSKPFDFTLDTVAPDVPQLKSPADGAIISKPQEKLSWESTNGASEYWVDVDDNDDFSSPLYEDSPAIKQFEPPTDLPQGMYYWRVQAKDEAGNVSDESDVWSFTVNILTSPADGEAIFMKDATTGASVSLRWEKVKSATGFMLYLYDDLSCTSLMVGYPSDMGTTTSVKVTLAKGQYCWKVQAVGVDSSIPDVSRTFMVSPPPLDAPELVSPENKSMTNDTTPTLDWNGVLDAVDYRIEWSTDKKFKTDIESDEIDAAATDYTLPALPDSEGTTYYWRVAAMSDLGVVGDWSKPFEFTLDTVAPDIPQLKSPEDGAIISKPQEKLSWESANGASEYWVDVDDNDDFSSPLYEDSPASKQFEPPTDLPQGMYYWRVQAKDEAGNVSDESDVWSFTVNILTSPADGEAIFMKGAATDASVSLRWEKVKSATSFILYLYNDLSCTGLMAGYPADMGTTTSVKVTLAKGQYCWKVQAVGVDSSIPDVSRTFMVSPPPLDAPELVSPENKSMTNDTTPTLDWNGVLDAVDYRIEWSTDKKFKTDIESDEIDAAATDYTLPALPDSEGTTYYWRVAAMSDLAVVGKWSKPFEFTLDTVAPDAPVLVAPFDLSIVEDSQPQFSWNKVSDAKTYDIQLDTIDPPVVTDTTTTNKYQPPAPLLLTDYYWRVRAIDEAGNVSDWSDAGDAWEVTISSKSLAPPVLNRFATGNPSPMDLPPTLCWSPISWAEGYELLVDNHDDFSSPIYSNDAIGDDTQCITLDPLYDGTWYWRVRAIRTGDDTNWSPTGTFTVES